MLDQLCYSLKLKSESYFVISVMKGRLNNYTIQIWNCASLLQCFHSKKVCITKVVGAHAEKIICD